MNIKKSTRLNASSTLILASLFSVSAAAAPLSLEGPIESIGPGTMTVMGVTVSVPATAAINSPTSSLTFSELADPTPLPGRLQSGFIGGTAIIEGDSLNGFNTAVDVFVEPAENIVGGEVTTNLCSTATCDGAGESFSVSGTTMIRLDDPRVPAGSAVNANGLIIDLTTTAIGSAAVAEGYYGADNYFYYFALEAEGSPLVVGPADLISISRARCRDDNNIRVEGGVFDATGTFTSSVSIVGFGTAPVIVDAVTGDGTYSYRGDISGACPATVTSQYKEAYIDANVDIQ
jgi:hypothetical protein